MKQPNIWGNFKSHRSLRIPDWRVLQQRDFLFLWASGGLSNICRWMEMGVLGWLLLELTNSPWQVALVGVFRSAPMLAFGLFSGLIADRLSRWRIMVITQAVNALVTAVLLVLLLTGAIQPWQVFLGAFMLGLSTILDFPSRRSFLYDLVGPQNLVSAMSLETVSNTLGKFLGPLVGGLFIELTGFRGVYLLLLVAYMLALFLITQMRARITRPPTISQPIWQSLASGVRYSLDNRLVMGVLCTTIIMNALAFSYVQLLPVVARDHLHVGPGLMGILASADGIGTLIGAMMIASLGNIRHHGRIFILGAMLELVSLVVFALSPRFDLSFALLVLVGVGNSGFSTMQTTIILLSAAPGMRGRALGVMGLCIGATPLGLLEMGALATFLHVQAAIGLNAVAALLLMLPIIRLTPLLSGPIASRTVGDVP
ncbi:MAG: MFS transporter [Nitrospinae bacterium]|nr:MFS transporter [Nitrospinota bacterium]